MTMTMSERLAALIKKSGYSQKELSQMVGVTEAAMTKYLKGERQPRPEIIANLATALNTTSDYIINGTEANEDFQYVYRLVARSASNMTDDEKMKLMKALLGK